MPGDRRLDVRMLLRAALGVSALSLFGATIAHAEDTPVVNDQPDITLPAPPTTEPGTPLLFSPSPLVSDPDVGAADMELEIDISDLDGVGGRSVPAGDYGTFTWGLGAAATSDLALDSLANLNAALATFTYTPPAGFSGTARIIFEIDDQGNTGTGGVLSRTRFIDITVVAAGDADPATNAQPDITLPAPPTTEPGTPLVLTPAPLVSDPDVGGGNMELEIDISDLDGVGGRSVPAGDYGTFTWGLGAAATSDLALDSLANLNAALATFTYTPPAGFSGTARIIFEIDDQGNTGSEFPPAELARTRFVDITVVAVGDAAPAANDPPDIDLPAPLATDTGVPLAFTPAPVVSDPDVGGGNMELEISISDLDGVGGLSVPAGDYGTFTWGLGSGVTSDLALGSLADLNAALATFTYTPPPGFTGTARIVFEIDDQGNSGSELPSVELASTRFVDITVADPPPTTTSTSTTVGRGLPATGARNAIPLLVALLALAAGTSMAATARRRI